MVSEQTEQSLPSEDFRTTDEQITISKQHLTDSQGCSSEERMLKKGVSKAKVLENLDEFLKENNFDALEAADKVKDDFRRYKILEASFSQQKTRVQESLLDYKKSLAALTMLAEQRGKKSRIDMTYKLDESLYSRATVEDFGKVCIWLGANIMVEYELDEAQKLLEQNLVNIERADRELSEDLDFLRDQITTTEVNVAHLHNYTMKIRRGSEATAQKESK